MSDARADDALDTVDLIYLEGTPFACEPPLAVRSLSEFSIGLKIGKATYDEREHAFWLVLDDFSGGIGHRRLDVREALGTCWDNEGGIDIRAARHITLPPRITSLDPDEDPNDFDYSVVGPVMTTPFLQTTLGGTFPTNDGWLLVGIGNKLYVTNKNRTTLTKVDALTSAKRINSVFEFCEDGDPTKRYVYYCGTSGTGVTVMRRAKNPVTGTTNWGDASAKVVESAIVWDNKIVAMIPVAKIVYSTDGANWSDDYTEPVTIWTSGVGSVDFIGVATSLWGASTVYFLNNGKLYMLDFYARTAYPIELGNKIRLVAGCVWQDSVIVTDGWNVWQYTAGTMEIVRAMSLRSKEGMPPSVASGRITGFISESDNLYAIFSLKTDGSTQLLTWTGSGWTTLGPEIATFDAWCGFIDALPILGAEVYSRRIWVVGSINYDNTDVSARLYALPHHGQGLIIGTDSFQDGPLSMITGWFDGGFADLEGALFKMKCDGFHLTGDETIKVEYRLDNDENANWTVLGTFNEDVTVLWFESDHKGLTFRTAQFKITLDRGNTATKSPLLVSLMTLYDKRPAMRTAWTARIDLGTMARGDFKIDGKNATPYRVWKKLRQLANTKTLIKMVIPSIEEEGIYVRIADLPGNFSSWRRQVGAKGIIDVQIVEPVETD